MAEAKKGDRERTQKNIKTLFVIGDEAAKLNFILEQMNLPSEVVLQPSCLNFEVFPISPQMNVEMYFFPQDRDLKTYCTLYFQSLPRPDLVIYVVDADSPSKQIWEWLDLVDTSFLERIVFFSDARTYVQRQQIFKKLSPLFHRDITDFIFFPNIDHSSISTISTRFCSQKEVGIYMTHYARKIPILTRVRKVWRRISAKFFPKKSQCQSVI